MKCYLQKNVNDQLQASFKFTFELEADDKTEAISYNAGKKQIFLGARSCSFDFPFDLAIPHPDLVCMAALKIISPYIGSSLKMERPVSEQFAQAAKAIYPNLQYVNTASTVTPRCPRLGKRKVCSQF